MATTLFDVRVRTIECAHCGAPFESSLEGGRMQCRFCGSVNEVAQRAREQAAAPPSMAEEVARLSRLKTQLENPLTGHAYDLDRVPLGCETLANGDPALVRQAWLAAKATAAASGEDQRRLLWLALSMAAAHAASGQKREERAVLETTLDLLADAGHRHLVRCRLAIEALADRDPTSAAGWLEECDPRQEVLLLDSAYREARARLCAAQKEAGRILEILGAEDTDVPIHPSHRAAAYALRVHALDAVGQSERADAQLSKARVVLQGDAVLERMRTDGIGMPAYLRARMRERDRMPNGILASAAAPVALWPILALIAFAPVTIARCSNLDPLLGVNGYAICRPFCQGCDGPLRVVTSWSCVGSECSTNGPQYFCPSPENGIAELTDVALEDRRSQFAAYELEWAPGATSLLLLGVLLTPFVVYWTIRRRLRHARRRQELDAEIAWITDVLRQPRPPDHGSAVGGFFLALLFCAFCAAFAFFVTALEIFSG